MYVPGGGCFEPIPFSEKHAAQISQRRHTLSIHSHFTLYTMGVLTDAKARASRLCEPSDDSMYKPMSHNVGDHYSKPRAASAPPERPHGSGTLHLHRFEGLITLPQKRHKENVVDARAHRIGGESELLDASNYDGYLPRRAKHAGMLGAPTGADSAIGATRVVDRDISPEVFEGALGQETRPDSLVAAEAGDSPSHRYSVVKAGQSRRQAIWQEPGSYVMRSGQHVRELMHGQKVATADNAALAPSSDAADAPAYSTAAELEVSVPTKTSLEAAGWSLGENKGLAGARATAGASPRLRRARNREFMDAAGAGTVHARDDAPAEHELTAATDGSALHYRNYNLNMPEAVRAAMRQAVGSPVFGNRFGKGGGSGGDGGGGGGLGGVGGGRRNRGAGIDNTDRRPAGLPTPGGGADHAAFPTHAGSSVFYASGADERRYSAAKEDPMPEPIHLKRSAVQHAREGALGATSEELGALRSSDAYRSYHRPPLEPDLHARSPIVRSPLVARYVDGALVGSASLVNDQGERVEEAYRSDPVYTSHSRAGASSVTINRTDAERFPGINERFDRPLAPRRGWGGPDEVGCLIRQDPTKQVVRVPLGYVESMQSAAGEDSRGIYGVLRPVMKELEDGAEVGAARLHAPSHPPPSPSSPSMLSAHRAAPGSAGMPGLRRSLSAPTRRQAALIAAHPAHAERPYQTYVVSDEPAAGKRPAPRANSRRMEHVDFTPSVHGYGARSRIESIQERAAVLPGHFGREHPQYFEAVPSGTAGNHWREPLRAPGSLRGSAGADDRAVGVPPTAPTLEQTEVDELMFGSKADAATGTTRPRASRLREWRSQLSDGALGTALGRSGDEWFDDAAGLDPVAPREVYSLADPGAVRKAMRAAADNARDIMPSVGDWPTGGRPSRIRIVGDPSETPDLPTASSVVFNGVSTDGLERAISVSNAAAAHVVAATLGGEAPGAETNKLVAAAQKRLKRASGIPEGSADDMALEALYRQPARLSRSRSFGTAATAQREQRERREAQGRPEPGGTKGSPSYDLEVQRQMIQRRAEELDAHRQLQQRRADQRERVYEGRLGMSTLHVSRSQLYRNFDTSAADATAPGSGEGGGVPRSASPLVRRAARNAGREAFSVIFGRGSDADGGSSISSGAVEKMSEQHSSAYEIAKHSAEVEGIVPGYTGHVPRARLAYGEAAIGGLMPTPLAARWPPSDASTGGMSSAELGAMRARSELGGKGSRPELSPRSKLEAEVRKAEAEKRARDDGIGLMQPVDERRARMKSPPPIETEAVAAYGAGYATDADTVVAGKSTEAIYEALHHAMTPGKHKRPSPLAKSPRGQLEAEQREAQVAQVRKRAEAAAAGTSTAAHDERSASPRAAASPRSMSPRSTRLGFNFSPGGGAAGSPRKRSASPLLASPTAGTWMAGAPAAARAGALVARGSSESV